jgi:uncharacterized protein (UPF0335 family)
MKEKYMEFIESFEDKKQSITKESLDIFKESF